MKENDVYRWSWNEKTLGSKKLEQQSGTLYWCCSRIGIVKNGVLVDTYWHGSENKSFTSEQIKEKLDIEFIANIDDLEKSEPYMRAMYLDEYCVDLNHPNSTRGNFYIKKGAKKNIDKMKRVLQRQVNEIERSIKTDLLDIESTKQLIESIDSSGIISVRSGVDLHDSSYQDCD